jgi:hypothetical protein
MSYHKNNSFLPTILGIRRIWSTVLEYIIWRTKNIVFLKQFINGLWTTHWTLLIRETIIPYSSSNKHVQVGFLTFEFFLIKHTQMGFGSFWRGLRLEPSNVSICNNGVYNQILGTAEEINLTSQINLHDWLHVGSGVFSWFRTKSLEMMIPQPKFPPQIL